jgi:ribosomal-protein-alanine N-acetyltransferase
MKNINFTPFPVLHTERLTLRQIEDKDAHALFALRTDKEVIKYIKRVPHANIDETRAFIIIRTNDIKENIAIVWAICLKEDPTMIGSICLWKISEDKTQAELGYDLSPAFHKQGYMSEAVKSVINFGFQTLGFQLLEAFTHHANESSVNLLLKHGFLHDTARFDPGNENNAIFVLKQNR